MEIIGQESPKHGPPVWAMQPAAIYVNVIYATKIMISGTPFIIFTPVSYDPAHNK
jgi:hypothetical protein